MWNVNECLRTIDAPIPRTADIVLFHPKRLEDLGVILDVEESIVVAETKIIGLARVRAEVYLVLSDEGGRILVVADATGLEFKVEGVALGGVVHRVEVGRLLKRGVHEFRETREVRTFTLVSKLKVVLLVSHLLIYCGEVSPF